MDMTARWTGRTACALQDAMRLSNERFAEHLGIGVRTVASWHQKPTLQPRSELQQILDTALEQASPQVKARFAQLVRDTYSPVNAPDHIAEAERRLATDPNISAALEWLDRQASWTSGNARRQVATRLVNLDIRSVYDLATHRGQVDQFRTAATLGEYYEATAQPYRQYSARCDDHDIMTSVLTCPDWLALAAPLIGDHVRMEWVHETADETPLDDEAAGQATQQLAEILASGVRLVDRPLYRLHDVRISRGSVSGSIAITRFVRYALTMDLLEGELVDALAANVPIRRGELPRRDRYLPDLDAVLNVGDRLCAGGVAALCAIARPANSSRGPADYVLLVQERSSQVLNAARRLAVVPKAFHRPLVDHRTDADISATLLREMEDELFGRTDLDNTVTDQRSADPMHPSRLSKPIRWLLAEPGRLRMECTGFGLNLVSGNYEFASLIVIDDEDFWTRHGGQIEANWETTRLRQYSSLDREQIIDLICDPTWSNEGLFAFLQGLRRLQQIGGNRVDLPRITREMLW